jgi:predicted RNA-binding protein YlxR (DUF448 family)
VTEKPRQIGHKLPLRTCVACRQSGDKRALIRFVRNLSGSVVLDLTGKAAGRGAYLCCRQECFLRAQKTRALERSLKTQISDDDYRRIAEDLRAVIYGKS